MISKLANDEFTQKIKNSPYPLDDALVWIQKNLTIDEVLSDDEFMEEAGEKGFHHCKNCSCEEDLEMLKDSLKEAIRNLSLIENQLERVKGIINE